MEKTTQRSNGPGKPKGFIADAPNKGSKMERLLEIIRGPRPPADLRNLQMRANLLKRFREVKATRSLVLKIRRYLTPAEVARYFPQ